MNESVQTPNGNTRVLILATLAFAVCFAGWTLFSPLAAYLKVEFNLSSTAVGLLLATPVLLGSIARVPIGVLTDKFGGRRVLVSCSYLAFSLCSSQVLRIATAFTDLWIFLRFGRDIIRRRDSTGFSMVSKEKQGLALGIYGVGNIGSAVATFERPSL